MINYTDINPQLQSQRILHEDCSIGKDACLVVTKVDFGFAWKCHRCGDAGFITDGAIVARCGSFDTVPTKNVGSVSLPDDTIRLLSHPYLDTHEIDKFRIGYSLSQGRIIYPIYDRSGKLIFWQGKDTHGESKCKYVSHPKGQPPPDVVLEHEGSSDLVIVEDFVSAIVCNRVMNSKPIFGSYLTANVLKGLSHQYETVYIWLDPDKQHNYIKLKMLTDAMGMSNVSYVYSQHDPKAENVLAFIG